MSKLIVLQGLPGSGKTTWAQQYLLENPNTVRVNRDELRLMLFGPNFKWSGHKEKLVKMAEKQLVFGTLTQGRDVIVDNTHLLGGGSRSWIDWELGLDGDVFWKGKVKVEVKTFTDVPITECILRDRQRSGRARVGAPVIYRMALEAGMIDLSGKDVAIFDVDGTLANLDHRLPFIQQTPKDYISFYSRVGLDPVFPNIAQAARWAHDQGQTVIILSGRPSSLPEYLPAEPGHNTVCWLNLHKIPYDYVFMRRGGDHKPDHETKREIWNAMVEKGKLTRKQVNVVYDDRDSICALWREIGLPLIKVDHDKIVEAW